MFLPDFAPAAAWACSSTGCPRKCRHHECAWRAGDGAMRAAIIRTACPLWTHRSTRTTTIKQVDDSTRQRGVLAEDGHPGLTAVQARPPKRYSYRHSGMCVEFVDGGPRKQLHGRLRTRVRPPEVCAPELGQRRPRGRRDEGLACVDVTKSGMTVAETAGGRSRSSSPRHAYRTPVRI